MTENQAADEEGREGPKTEEVCMWERLLGKARREKIWEDTV